MSTLIILLVTLILLGLSALFSGLTLGLLSLSVEEVRRKAKLGDPEAELIYPIRARGHELLVTLVVGNVLVNAALTLMLRELLPSGGAWAGVFALFVATVLITYFGEILPQAYLKRNGLKVGAALAPYIEFCMRLTSPISKPLVRTIDKAVGKEMATLYSNEELLHILEEHIASTDGKVEADELRIVRSALAFGDMMVEDVMTPRSVMTTVNEDEVITTGLLAKLQKSGHSRIPVYDEEQSNIVGMIYMYDLIGKQKPGLTAKQAASREAYFVNDQQHLDHVLNAFIKTRNHLFIVVNSFGEVVGLITIEDILEEIIGREIMDEFDKYEDMREVAQLHAKERKSTHNIVTKGKG